MSWPWKIGRKHNILRFSAISLTAVVFAAGGWAGHYALSGPDREVVSDEEYVLAEATYGTVKQTLSLNTSVSWDFISSFSTQADGMITEVHHENGDEVHSGDVLFTVDLQPVVAVAGAIPSFRSLSAGDEGEDVQQLEEFLISEGYYHSPADGDFDQSLYWAVRAWQKDLGMNETGTVAAGTVLFIPELPARASLSPDITVGSSIPIGTVAVKTLPVTPDFKIELPGGQARLIKPGMEVSIETSESSWQALISKVQSGQEGFTATLKPFEGNSICGNDCDQVPIGDTVFYSSTIFTVPPVDGVTVPAAAVSTDASGHTVVVTAAGEEIRVEVVAGAEGTVVISGLEGGMRVRVPGEQS